MLKSPRTRFPCTSLISVLAMLRLPSQLIPPLATKKTQKPPAKTRNKRKEKTIWNSNQIGKFPFQRNQTRNCSVSPIWPDSRTQKHYAYVVQDIYRKCNRFQWNHFNFLPPTNRGGEREGLWLLWSEVVKKERRALEDGEEGNQHFSKSFNRINGIFQTPLASSPTFRERQTWRTPDFGGWCRCCCCCCTAAGSDLFMLTKALSVISSRDIHWTRLTMCVFCCIYVTQSAVNFN